MTVNDLAALHRSVQEMEKALAHVEQGFRAIREGSSDTFELVRCMVGLRGIAAEIRRGVELLTAQLDHGALPPGPAR